MYEALRTRTLWTSFTRFGLRCKVAITYATAIQSQSR
jgi:hypothetical protein